LEQSTTFSTVSGDTPNFYRDFFLQIYSILLLISQGIDKEINLTQALNIKFANNYNSMNLIRKKGFFTSYVQIGMAFNLFYS